MSQLFDLRSCKVGQYNYAPHRSCVGVWKCVSNDEHRACGEFVCDFSSYQEAKDYVYRMNGWKK